MTKTLFGTDGIRGVANRYPMTAEIALNVGRAVAKHFKGQSRRVDRQSIVLIGKDTRRSSYMIEQALAAGVMSQGAFALLVGPMPTPGVAFLTQSMRADAGIMVSASHNSYEYNGIKLFGFDGFKLDDSIEARIEKLVLDNEPETSLPIGDGLGRAKRIDDAMGRYVVHAKSTFPSSLDLAGMRVVLDTANGAAYKFAPIVFEELGAEIFQIGNTPNGININSEVGALYPELVQDSLHRFRADIGIALDGDADRAILVDEKGAVVDGDQILALLALDLKERGALKNDTLVVTQMSNLGLDLALKAHGIKIARCDVGDRAVMETMKAAGSNLGGEQSGHIVLGDSSTTGDGTVAALAVLSVMLRKEKPLSELRKIVQPLPQLLRNIRVKDKKDLNQLSETQKALKSVEQSLSGKGRVLLRYSGTEPLCRIMLEGENEVALNSMADDLEAALKKDLS
ncbi:phosphoglucosamine mutase [bacterium]|nr:phosphoglucosamine mutase [bacterium]